MGKKMLKRIDTVEGWNFISYCCGVCSVACLGLYLYLIG